MFPYPRAKFLSLDSGQRVRILLKLCRKIETERQNTAARQDLVIKLCEGLSFLKDDKDGLYRKLFDKASELSETADPSLLYHILVPLEVAAGQRPADQDFLVTSADSPERSVRTIPLVIVLDNLRSSFNVGSIIRSAECFALEEVVLCGYTPAPGTSGRNAAMGTEIYQAWRKADDALRVLDELTEKGYSTVAVETGNGVPSIHEADLPSPCTMVFGNEKYGISKKLLQKCNKVVQIPLYGRKNSLNVAACFAICACEVSRRLRID